MSHANGNGVVSPPPNVIMHDVVDSLSTGMNLIQLNLLTQEMPDNLRQDLTKVVGYMRKMSQDLELLAETIHS